MRFMGFFRILFIFFCGVYKKCNCSLLFEVTKRHKCFIEQIFIGNSSLMLKWNINTNTFGNKNELENAIKNINIMIKNTNNNKIAHYHIIQERKGKVSFSIKERGEIYICVFINNKYEKVTKGIEMNLKIRTDEIYLATQNENILQKKEVEKTSKSILKAKDEIKKINNEFEIEKKGEGQLTNEIFHSIQTYKIFTYIQILLVIIVSLLHLYNFKKYIKSLHII